jgi:hypothetical protein
MTTSTIIFQFQSFLILCVLFFGVYRRKTRKVHIKSMATAMLWDILLILQIELSRSAIVKAAGAVMGEKVDPMNLRIHLFFAISSVVLYGVMIFTGGKLLKGNLSIKPVHKFCGWTTIIFRVLTFVTSFWAVSK